jgi:membrane protease YdiL (CAAX protease family)
MDSHWPRSLASIRLVLLFQLPSLLIRELIRLRLQQGGVAASSADHLSAIAGHFILAIMLAPLLAPARASVLALFRAPADWRRVVITAILSGLLLRAAGWSIAFGAVFLGVHGEPEFGAAGPLFWWQCPSWSYLSLSIGVLAVATPLVEETLNRGVILGGLLARGVRGSVTLSAALFAAFHAVHNLPIAFLFGVTAARMMIRDRSLLGPVIGHATFNALTVVDWDCIDGVWAPACTSLAAGLGSFLIAAALWVAAMQIVGIGGAGPSARPGAPDPLTRRSRRVR